MDYDLIIVGGGPAGLSAGIYAARKKLRVLLLAKELGGQILEAGVIENYLGIPGTPGAQLAEIFAKHLKKFQNEIEIKEGESVRSIAKNNNGFSVETENGEKYAARTILITSGRRSRKLDIPGAKEFEGKGIVYCATCDAPLFEGKNVAVVGAGNAALDAALQLTKYSPKIYMLNRSEKITKADAAYISRVEEAQTVEIINNADLKEIKGDSFVKQLVYFDKTENKEKVLEVEGIFVEIGSLPVVDFINFDLKFSEQGEIIVDPKTNAASEPGIFAAGDVTDVPVKQIIVAAGEGAKAIVAIFRYLNS